MLSSHYPLCPSPKLPKAYFSFSATFIRRPRGPLLQARPRVTNHSHQAPRNWLRSRHKYPMAWWCSKPRPSTPREMGKTSPRHLGFQAKQTENELSDTRLILPNYPRLFQRPPLRVYLRVIIQSFLLTVLQLYRKNILKRLQRPGFQWQPFRACILDSMNVPKGLRGSPTDPFWYFRWKTKVYLVTVIKAA